MTVPFPPGFLWGAATSAYQIEGATLADGRGPSIWDTFSRTPGAVAGGATGDVACDHYRRYREDLDLVHELGLQSYRFSVAWPRIQPNGAGEVNAEGLAFYDALVDGLLQRGITPMVTLYHWDLPQALQDLGGWPQRDTAYRFADYCVAVHRRLGDRVRLWVTVNEPYCSAFVGHLEGRHAPGVRDEGAAVRAAHHLLLGHGLAVEALRAEGLRGEIGITLNLTSVSPASGAEADVAAAERLDLYENTMFLDPVLRGKYPDDAVEYYREITDFAHVQSDDCAAISQPLDFLGVNYYERHAVTADPAEPVRGWRRVPDADPNVVGIGVHPEGLYEVLRRLSDDYDVPPVYVTENGLALRESDGDLDDASRVDFLDGHLRAVRQAIDEGVDVRGYFAWSLMDNFEWAWGYDVRFGLVHVDFETQQRTPKTSARWFREVAAHNALP